MEFITVAYYTVGTPYEEYSQSLIQSLRRFGLPYKVVPIVNQGDWYKNTQYKPTFLLRMLGELNPAPLVYVDVDAIVHRPPTLFNELAHQDVDLAAYILDHSLYGRRAQPELLSGTIYLANNSKVRDLVVRWIANCQAHPLVWDQAALKQVLEESRGSIKFFELSAQYCTIFDYMSSVPQPVIVHYQASRTCRTQKIRP